MKNELAPHFYFDVDNTLIHIIKDNVPVMYKEYTPCNINFCNSSSDAVYNALYFNNQMIDLLLASHQRGHIIVLWSAGGAAWARKVADEIEKRWGHCIDYCLSKPAWWADDKTSESVLPEVNRVIPTIPKGAL